MEILSTAQKGLPKMQALELTYPMDEIAIALQRGGLHAEDERDFWQLHRVVFPQLRAGSIGNPPVVIAGYLRGRPSCDWVAGATDWRYMICYDGRAWLDDFMTPEEAMTVANQLVRCCNAATSNPELLDPELWAAFLEEQPLFEPRDEKVYRDEPRDHRTVKIILPNGEEILASDVDIMASLDEVAKLCALAYSRSGDLADVVDMLIHEHVLPSDELLDAARKQAGQPPIASLRVNYEDMWRRAGDEDE